MRLSTFAPFRQSAGVRTEQPLRAIPDGSLAAFNRQVAQHQEEAYTLALYLLGGHDAALQTVQNALLSAYQRSSRAPENPRLRLLQAVIRCSEASHAASIPVTGETIEARLFHLPQPERRAAILVDVLGLSYSEAAQVLDCATAQISGLLARARVQFMRVL